MAGRICRRGLTSALLSQAFGRAERLPSSSQSNRSNLPQGWLTAGFDPPGDTLSTYAPRNGLPAVGPWIRHTCAVRASVGNLPPRFARRTVGVPCRHRTGLFGFASRRLSCSANGKSEKRKCEKSIKRTAAAYTDCRTAVSLLCRPLHTTVTKENVAVNRAATENLIRIGVVDAWTRTNLVTHVRR